MVLVVVVLLSLGAYTFSEMMIVEAESTNLYGRTVAARAFADSGVELVAAYLHDKTDRNPETFYHNPAWFQGVLMRQGFGAKGTGRFSVVAPVEIDPMSQMVRFGLIDESAKLNLNAFSKLGLNEDDSRLVLMALPEMTEEIADAILDWIDQDDNVRAFGAESDFYLSLTPAYEAKNGPIDSIDELLLVSGVTPWLLFGEDANRNGLLDPNENDGDLHPPFDNADGVLQRGWSAYLTVHSRETNLQADGTARINVNGNALSDLYDKLAEGFDETTAKFVVAFRMNGPVQQPGSTSGQSGGGSGSPGSGGNSGGNSGNQGSSGGNSGGASSSAGRPTSGGSSSGGGSSGGGGSTSSAGAQNAAMQQAASALGSAAAAASGGTVTRAGMDLTKGGSKKLKSLYEMVGVKVRVTYADGKPAETIDSPWKDDPSEMPTYLPVLMDKLTLRDDKFIEGRVNVNEARYEVLLGVPQMTEELAKSIVDAQSAGMGGSLAGQVSDRATTGWLYTSGIVPDVATLAKYDPYITARGDVFRMQVIGYFDGGGPTSRLEAVIDATQNPPQVVFLRDLSDLGRGYSPFLLTGGRSR